VIAAFTPQTIFVKTLFGRAELAVRSHGLSLLERRVLILADGTRSMLQLQAMMNAPVDAIVHQLQALHLIVPEGSAQNSSVSGHAALLASMGRNTPAQASTFLPISIAPVATVAAKLEEDHEHDALVDEMASNFSEELTFDGVSAFERQVSTFSVSQSHADIGTMSDPSSTMQRAITSRGVALGKAYLINLTSTLLDSRDVRLLRSIGQIKTEDDLYQQFGQVIDTIATRMGSSAINDILEQFDQEINRA
jgi:hypothetical protein